VTDKDREAVVADYVAALHDLAEIAQQAKTDAIFLAMKSEALPKGTTARTLDKLNQQIAALKINGEILEEEQRG